MKQVQITSRGIPSKPRSQYRTGGTTTTIMGGGGTDVDLSAYMLLSRWLENFEERTDASGIPYLYAKKSIVSVGGITMYATEDVVVPSIFDGIPLDNKTIWKNPTTGKIEVIGGTGGSFDESAMWAALAGSTTEQINKSHLTTALTGYATESWVSGKNYAVKATTLAGYGITDAYTKTESDSKYPTKTGSGASGTWGINITGNAGSATKLQTARTLWGRSFDGTGNVSGNLDSVGNITGSGTIDVITKNNQNIRFKINNDDTLSVLLELKSFRPFGAASNSINLGLSDAKWKDLYLGGDANIDGVTKTGDFYIGGIRLHKTADGVITLEGNLAVTGGVTMYAIDPVSASTIMDGVVVDGTTIKKENGKLVAVGGGEAGGVAWGNISGKPSVFPTNIVNITDLHSSWDSVLAAQKPAWLTAVSIATISDLHANWDALLKAAPSAYVTRWPTISEVTGKQNLIVKLNGGTTEGTNQFTYNATGAKTINITPAGIGAAASSHNHSWSNITSGKPTTLAGYGITDAPTKTGSGASGTWGINVTGNAGSATKLQTTCNLWGHSFNGQQNISGDLTGVGKIKYNNGEYFDEYGNMHLPTSLEKNYWTIFNSNGAELIKVNGIGGIIGSAFRADNWYRSTGNTGWQNETYGGGWYMQDSSYIRSYNNKSIHIGSGSYITANGGYKVNNDANTSEVWNCRYIVESLSVPAGNVRNILGWYDSSSSGYTTSYIIGSKRAVGNNWGELMLGVYQYEGANRSVAVYMGLDGAGGRVYIGGNLLVTGGGTFYGSDIRYKSIMQQVNLSLLDIAKAPSFVYHWNREGMKCDRLNLGGSAQYTQSVLPWAVEEKDNFLSMDYATVAYTFAVHTARHLMNYETRTDKKIKKLENRVKYLEKQLKKLGYEEVRTLDDQSV